MIRPMLLQYLIFVVLYKMYGDILLFVWLQGRFLAVVAMNDQFVAPESLGVP